MKKLLIAAALAAAGTAAQANVISTTVNISASNPGSVQYVNFYVSDPGNFSISAEGSDTLNPDSLYNWDPQIYLFAGSLSAGNLLASNDDSGSGLNALISSIGLGIGNFILAVSEFDFSLSEALSGNNVNGVDDPGRVRVTISSNNGYSRFGHQYAVPEPATLGLLGLGLLGVAVARRRRTA
jgi:hypothetical protein